MRTEEAGSASDQGCRRNFLNDGRMTFRAFLWHDLRGTFFWWSLRHKSVRRLRRFHRFIAKKSSHKKAQEAQNETWHTKASLGQASCAFCAFSWLNLYCVICVICGRLSFSRSEFCIARFDPGFATPTFSLPLFMNRTGI